MKKQKKIIVIGGGFKGLVAALKFSKKGHEVSIIESSKNLGGFLNSPTWGEITIDLGCHLFINEYDSSTDFILSVLGGEYKKIHVNYASFLNKKKTEGLAIPNFNLISSSIKEKVKLDFHNMDRKKIEEKTLRDYYINRFGKNILPSIDSCILKSHLIDSKSLDINSKNLLPYNRIKFFTEKDAISLKKKSWFDERIAVKHKTLKSINYKSKKLKYNFREFYPKNNGLNFFLHRMINILKKKNVALLVNNKISGLSFENKKKYIITDKNKYDFDHLYWAAPQHLTPKIFNIDVDLDEFVHHVPLVLIYYLVPKKFVSNYAYIHNYDLEINCFRVSIQSNYASNGIPDDLALICCEIPVEREKNIWEQPNSFIDIIWDELIKMELVSPVKYLKFKFFKTPSAYKLPLYGYSECFTEVVKHLQNYNLSGFEQWEYSKNTIIKAVEENLKYF